MIKPNKLKEVFVKGYYDKEGDIVIPVTKDGGFHVIPKTYHKDVDLVEVKMTVKEVRKTLIEVIKHIDTYSDRELVEIISIADKLKEMAIYEEFCREKERKDD